MKNLEDKIVEIITKLEELTPDATGILLETVSMIAVSEKLHAFFSLIILSAVFFVIYTVNKKYIKKQKAGGGTDHADIWGITGMALIIPVVLFGVNLTDFLDMKDWFFIFNPEMKLAYSLIPR